MHQNNEDRRRGIQSISRQLQDIASARLQLVQQLENMDTQAAQLHSERSMLYTLGTTISHLPDETLATIFEEGTIMNPMTAERWPEEKYVYSSQHFGVLVSHIARRWRNIALDTPRLWTDIQCFAKWPVRVRARHERRLSRFYPETFPIFLSRAKSLPVDITIARFEDVEQDHLQLMSDYIGHCRRLCMKDLRIDALMMLLHCVSSRPVPFLSSICLDRVDTAYSDDEETIFRDQLFQRGAPRLTTVELVCVDFRSMHLCLHAFNSVTSLRLVDILANDEGRYDALRDSLMSLKSLHHLELFVAGSLDSVTFRLPMVLPTLQLLHLYDHDNPETLSSVIRYIEAPSLIALSLKDPVIPTVLEHRFPSMRHLLVTELDDFEDCEDFEKNLVVLAQSFPDIEQLTFQNGQDMDDVFAAIICGDSQDNIDGGRVVMQWPKLQTIAVSARTGHFNASKLQDSILRSQRAGRPIRKLLLPRTVISGEGADALVELGKLVEIDKFDIDWPTPFDWSKD